MPSGHNVPAPTGGVTMTPPYVIAPEPTRFPDPTATPPQPSGNPPGNPPQNYPIPPPLIPVDIPPGGAGYHHLHRNPHSPPYNRRGQPTDVILQ
jgi:hypothetical protein